MADFERKLTTLADRGTPVGPEEMIERVEAQLAEDPLVVVTKQRKGWGMSVKTDDKEERKQGSTGRGMVWAAVAFVAVIGIAALFFAFGGEPASDVVQPAPPTTVVTETTLSGVAAELEVAEALGVALQNHDVEGARDLLSEDATVDLAAIQSADLLEEQRDFWMATGWVFVVDECVEGDLQVIRCFLIQENDWTRAIGAGPYEGSSYFIEVEDGKVTSIRLDFDSASGFSRDGWEPFYHWVARNHYEDLRAMFEGTLADGNTFRYDEPAIVLWESYTDEYVEEVGG